MTVAELIEELEKMPKDREVIMFDWPSYYTPSDVYIYKYNNKKLYNKVIIR